MAEKHNKIECPRCDHFFVLQDYERAENDLWAIAPEEASATEKCPSCKKTFYIQGGYIPIYATYKTEDELEDA